METSAVLVGIMTVELHLPDSHSLKEKRMVLNRLKSRLHHRSNVAISEVDHQDVWQRSAIAIVTVGGSRGRLERVLDEVRAEIESQPDALIAFEEREYR
ncbi:MAG: DUF503 domain-containing protein [Acidobacteriota bacterium]